MDICITIPKTTNWNDYQRELAAVKDGKQVMLFRVPNRPKNVNKGDKCYLCYNGNIIGWMTVVDVIHSDGFKCTTSGNNWPEGWYVARSGEFHKIEPIPMKGFQGIRYMKSNNIGNMKTNTIKLNESDLKKIVKEAFYRAINEPENNASKYSMAAMIKSDMNPISADFYANSLEEAIEKGKEYFARFSRKGKEDVDIYFIKNHDYDGI